MTCLTVLAVHQRIGEAANVTRSHPCLGIHQDSGIQTYIVLVFLNELLLPSVLQVVLEHCTERAVVPCICETAIDLTTGINEASALAECNDFVKCLFCV